MNILEKQLISQATISKKFQKKKLQNKPKEVEGRAKIKEIENKHSTEDLKSEVDSLKRLKKLTKIWRLRRKKRRHK